MFSVLLPMPEVNRSETMKTAIQFLHNTLWLMIMYYQIIPGLVTKCSVVQNISFGQTFTNILNLCCDLDLESNNPYFPQNTLAYDAASPHQVW